MAIIIGSIVYVGGVVFTFRSLFDIRINPLTLVGYSLFWPITLPYLWWGLYKRASQQDIINSFTKEERELAFQKAREMGIKDI